MSAQSDSDDRISLSAFLRMPEEDGWRVELVRGQLVREPGPATLHGRVLTTLVRLLDPRIVERDGGVVLTDTGFIVARDPDSVLVPDLAFVSAARLPADPWAQTFLSGAPDLAIEVLSPTNRPAAMREKVRMYHAAGARLVWIVDPGRRTVTVHRSDGTSDIVTALMTLDAIPVVSDLSIAVRDIFPG